MTTELPQQTITDRILRMLGKQRAIHIPNAEGKYGPYVYAKAKKEPFVRALLRPKGSALRDGWIYMDRIPSGDTPADANADHETEQ